MNKCMVTYQHNSIQIYSSQLKKLSVYIIKLFQRHEYNKEEKRLLVVQLITYLDLKLISNINKRITVTAMKTKMEAGSTTYLTNSTITSADNTAPIPRINSLSAMSFFIFIMVMIFRIRSKQREEQ